MPVYNALPSGTNKCIGSYSNETTGMLYSFIWNSNGEHTINEYNSNTETIFPVLQGSFLNFQEFEYINGVGMIDGSLLYWTDGYNPPRGIDVNSAKITGYYTTGESISLIKPAPQEIISTSYGNGDDSTTASNRLKGQLFQFRYLYVYEDNSRSAWSSISQLPVPELEVNSDVDTEPYKNNHILLSFDAGTKYVKTIEIAAIARNSSEIGVTNDWFSILSVSRDDVVNTVNYDYNSITNTATYRFYNDGLYQSIDVLETDLPYDFVPLKSKALDIVNGNVLVLGNNTEGYDNIETNVSISVDYDNPQTTARLAVIYSPILMTNPLLLGIPIAGDVITYVISTIGTGTSSSTYTVTAGVAGSLYDTAVALGNSINSFTGGAITFNPPTILPGDTFSPNGYVELNPVYANPAYSLDSGWSVALAPGASFSSPVYKTNSKYQLGLVYYDYFNRSSYVQTSDRFIVSTDSWGASAGESPIFNWNIYHDAPSWATKYQWVRTEQLTHKKFLFWVGTSVTVNASNSSLYDIDLSSFNSYNTDNNNSILSYDYTPGDRCTVHKQGSTWKTGYDVSVVDYNETTGILTIQSAGALTTGTVNTLVEIYTPKTRSNSPQEQFFYEFGEQYSCANGVHSVTSGTLSSGDIYQRLRPMSATVNEIVEDPNFSDFYISNFSSNGRTNIFAPQARQLTLPTDVRYSDTYVPNTNINGLSRFYGDAYETYDRVNGSIQKLSVRDNYLLTFQEHKTGYIPVEQSIIEDQGTGNQANVAISSKLLNKIRYFAGDYGIGLHPESLARFAGTVYFADPNRGMVIKLTNALQPISMIGMDSFFTKNISDINRVENSKIIGTYDPRNDEYIITLKYELDEDSLTVAYSELINRWTTFYSFIPENGAYIYNKYFTFKDGNMYIHNVNEDYNTFYGVSYNSIVSLTYNQSPLAIKSFIGVIEQSTSPWAPVSAEDKPIETSLGQESSLEESDFEYKEGVYFASLLRDSNSPGGLLNGDDLKGNWIKLRLVNDSSTKENLLSVDVRHIPSYQGIK